MEALSEQKCEAKWNKNKLRVSHVDNINMALDFAKKLGVSVKNFPQATDFIDGQERPVLGFVWACILKFLKFGDDADDSLNAKDALLLWVCGRKDDGERRATKKKEKDKKNVREEEVDLRIRDENVNLFSLFQFLGEKQDHWVQGSGDREVPEQLPRRTCSLRSDPLEPTKLGELRQLGGRRWGH